jgi:hypothetical protein
MNINHCLAIYPCACIIMHRIKNEDLEVNYVYVPRGDVWKYLNWNQCDDSGWRAYE